jgi:single-stranded DNA-binding protein
MTYRVKFEGNVGNEVFYKEPTDDKIAFLPFSVAESHTVFENGDPKLDSDDKRIMSEADWSDVKVFGDVATASKDLKSGQRVQISGRVEVEAYIAGNGEPKGKLVVFANRVERVDFAKKSNDEKNEKELAELNNNGR